MAARKRLLANFFQTDAKPRLYWKPAKEGGNEPVRELKRKREEEERKAAEEKKAQEEKDRAEGKEPAAEEKLEDLEVGTESGNHSHVTGVECSLVDFSQRKGMERGPKCRGGTNAWLIGCRMRKARKFSGRKRRKPSLRRRRRATHEIRSSQARSQAVLFFLDVRAVRLVKFVATTE